MLLRRVSLLALLASSCITNFGIALTQAAARPSNKINYYRGGSSATIFKAASSASSADSTSNPESFYNAGQLTVSDPSQASNKRNEKARRRRAERWTSRLDHQCESRSLIFYRRSCAFILSPSNLEPRSFAHSLSQFRHGRRSSGISGIPRQTVSKALSRIDV
jgi:hypothetical protein